MEYNQMLNNVVNAINCICLSNNYLIDIYRDKEDVKIDIVDKNEKKLIYKNDIYKAKDLYSLLLEDLINNFENDGVMISKLFQNGHTIYQQGIYVNNLEFRFDIDSKNAEEVNSAFERHNKITCKTQQNKIKIKEKN